MTPEGPQEREEVFYTIPLQGRRRHSVGGYLATGGAGTGEVTSVPSDVPKMPAPKFAQREDEVKRRRPKNFPFKGTWKILTYQRLKTNSPSLLNALYGDVPFIWM